MILLIFHKMGGIPKIFFFSCLFTADDKYRGAGNKYNSCGNYVIRHFHK